MNRLILLIASAVALQAQTAVINGATARFRITASTSAPSSSACDASNEVGSLHIRTGNQSSVPTGVSICKQTGSSTYAWGPIGWYSQTTAPATCVVGEIWFDTDASAGSNLNLCTSTNTFTAVSGGGAGTPAGSTTEVQYNSSGSFGAEAGFEYDPATNTLSVDKISLTGAASESVLTDISTPSAPSAGKTATYTKSGRWCTRANGGSEVCYADGNSSGEATKGVAGAYDATSWNGSSETPTKDAVRDKIESMSSGGASTLSFSYPPVQDGAGWRASTLSAFSGDNNAVGFYPWNETDGSKYALVKGMVPAGWTSGTVTAYITFQGSGSGNAIQWKVSVSCDQGDTFSTADNFSSQTTSASTRYRLSKTLTLTGCSATDSIIYKIQRVDTNGVGYIFAFDVTYAIP
jgi:hypothetical protein